MRVNYRQWARDAYKWEEGHFTWGELVGVFCSLWVTAITGLLWFGNLPLQDLSFSESCLLFGLLILSCVHRQAIFARVQRRAHLHRLLTALRGQDNGQMAA